MYVTCSRCGETNKAKAKYCGHCGSEIMHAIQPVHRHQPGHVVAEPMAPLAPCPADGELAAQTQLEVATRLNPLMNQERMKAMALSIAAHGGTGTVGFWSDC